MAQQTNPNRLPVRLGQPAKPFSNIYVLKWETEPSKEGPWKQHMVFFYSALDAKGAANKAELTEYTISVWRPGQELDDPETIVAHYRTLKNSVAF